MSAGTVTFQSPPAPTKTLLERLKHDIWCHSQEYHHVTPPALLAELEAAISEEKLAAHIQGIAANLAAAQAARAPAPRFVEVREVGSQLPALILIAIDQITKVRLYSPGAPSPLWTVALTTADGPYRREFPCNEEGERQARAFIALCTRSP